MQSTNNNLRHLLIKTAMVYVLATAAGNALAQEQSDSVERNAITAIDILLEPDATMLQHAEAANARLLKVFPKGFALDATHRPHITLLQRYVRTADLDKAYAAAGKGLTKQKPSWKLQATKYYYLPMEELGVAGIVVKPTNNLLKLQKQLLTAVAPFTVKTATAAAFVTTPEDPEINQPTIDYIAMCQNKLVKFSIRTSLLALRLQII